MNVKLEFLVSKIIFKGDDNFVILAGQNCATKNECVVFGKMLNVGIATQLSLTGNWTNNPKFGKQFKVKDCITQLPKEVVGIEKFLGSHFAKGIGEATAKKIVAKFGENTLQILDSNPDLLLNVSGINRSKLDAIINSWQNLKEYSTIIIPIINLGISKNLAHKIYTKYGAESFAKVQENPYLLIDDLWGIGFLRADEIAVKLSIKQDSPQRIKSGLAHVLKSNLENGSLYLDIEDFLKKSELLLCLQKNIIEPIFEEMLLSNELCKIEQSEKLLISFYKIFLAEQELANMTLALLKTPLQRFPFDICKIQRELSCATPITLSDEQQQAICLTLANRLTIITGGPGTGKTTLLKALIKILKDHKYTFELAAPTGRASKRISQTTLCFAQTIHRLLEFDPILKQFTRNTNKTITSDFLIIDEFSMVDLFLANAVFRAIDKNKTQVLFIGDIDQLPSVGPGKILADLINSQKAPIVRLTNIFRQANASLIIENAHRVNASLFPTSQIAGFKKDFYFIKKDEPSEFYEILKQCFQKSIKTLGITPGETMVLTPMHKGVVGSIRINMFLQDLLNGEQQEQIFLGETKLKVGDPVMQKRNNYDKGVFNGDIGTVSGVKKNEDETELSVTFDERIIRYRIPAELSELTLAYAISIHKSQGSEFPAVIIPIFTQHFMMLNKNVLYTAITRAKQLCVLVGQTKAVAIAVKNCQPDDRITLLKDLLKIKML